ncbi:Oidioi.mRNA.OKI2018_I69.chr1.g1704.t1.cds [Oikopleura dioica]|uniref:Oidioi.mRNA.OKI2018_I69.chr1.g1704.t1.cds n=1 Tax=Oikopleura dioica TaxID=34765 RepID=A0ABN7SSZ0_OIKDI|nr:Oidioi.mRNA.OKI2018_I69.chr1.g1704.t1.cds [Oikopleura dioica]
MRIQFEHLKPYTNVCQPKSSAEKPAHFFVGDEDWDAEKFPGAQDNMSPNLFNAEGQILAQEEMQVVMSGDSDIPVSDCHLKLIPKKDEKIFVASTNLTTDMTSCGHEYLAINDNKKCGGMNMTDPNFSMTNFENVELGDAGEVVFFHLKNDNPVDGYFMFILTTQ